MDTGDAFLDDPTTVFCLLGDPTRPETLWYLLYVGDTRHAGFLPATALRQNPIVTNCSQL